MKHFFTLFIIAGMLFAGCGGAEKALKKGQYDLAINKAVKKLRKNKSKGDQVKVLEEAYKIAQQRDFDAINFIKKEGSPDQWDEIHVMYSRIKRRQDMVKVLLPLAYAPTKGGMIQKAQFKIVDVDSELIQSKQNAAEYFYARAVALMDGADRFKAREAHAELLKVKRYYPNFKDVDAQLAKAYELGTTKVLFKMKKEIPAPLPPDFEKELMKISLQDLNQHWIRYYTTDTKGTNYDYTVFVNLKVIDVSPETVKDVHFSEKKKIKDGWEYQLDENGNVMKDSLGNDIKKPKYKTISCKVVETQLRKMARVGGSIDYVDNHTRQLHKTENIMAESFFEDGEVRVLSGDVNALTPATKAKIGHKPRPFPSGFDMILMANGNLKNMVKDILYRNKGMLN